MEELKKQPRKEPKKIRILICDDREVSSNAVIASVFQPPSSDLTFEELLDKSGKKLKEQKSFIDLANECLHIVSCQTVSEAVTRLEKGEVFDIAWVDINFEEGDYEENDDIRAIKPQYRGLYLIRRLKEGFPNTIVKVHSRFAMNKDILSKIQLAGFDLGDVALILDYQDAVIAIGDQLSASFTEALKDTAKNFYYEASDSLERQRIIDNDISEYGETNIEKELASLHGYSLQKLLVGWSKIEQNADGDWKVVPPAGASLKLALKEFKSLKNLPIQLGGLFAPNKKGYPLLTEYRQNATYGGDTLEIRRRAEQIILQMMEAWRAILQEVERRKYALEDWTNRTSNTEYIIHIANDLLPDVAMIEFRDSLLGRTQNFMRREPEWRQILQNLLIARLIVIGMLKIYNIEKLGSFPYVIDFSILYGILQRKQEFMNSLRLQMRGQGRLDIVQAHFKTTLGIAGALSVPQRYYWDNLLPEEQEWLRSDFFTLYIVK